MRESLRHVCINWTLSYLHALSMDYLLGSLSFSFPSLLTFVFLFSIITSVYIVSFGFPFLSILYKLDAHLHACTLLDGLFIAFAFLQFPCAFNIRISVFYHYYVYTASFGFRFLSILHKLDAQLHACALLDGLFIPFAFLRFSFACNIRILAIYHY